MKKALTVSVEGQYGQLFEAVLREKHLQEPDWLTEQRTAAFDRFLQSGVPTKRQEEWKYTDVSRLAAQTFATSAPAELAREQLGSIPLYHESDHTFVFLDGVYRPDLSGLTVTPGLEAVAFGEALDSAVLSEVLKSALARTNIPAEGPFVCLNHALWRDGLLLRVQGKQKVERRIHVVFLHTGQTDDALISPRLVVALGGYAEARLAVTHVSCDGGRALSNGVVDMVVGEGARLEVCHVQALGPQVDHLCTTRVMQARDSHVHSLDFAVGSKLARHDLSVSLREEGASLELDGLYALRGRQLIDNHTTIEHLRPHCRSRQLYKGILDDASTAVFNGLVRVHPGAHGTDGVQLNKNLLLSADARVNTKPELQIANDDVRCMHGATIGQLDAQERFYLESRGIHPDIARNMLSRGFVEDVIYRFEDDVRRKDLHALLDGYFERGE